jgi:hypothetical protein
VEVTPVLFKKNHGLKKMQLKKIDELVLMKKKKKSHLTTASQYCTERPLT